MGNREAPGLTLKISKDSDVLPSYVLYPVVEYPSPASEQRSSSSTFSLHLLQQHIFCFHVTHMRSFFKFVRTRPLSRTSWYAGSSSYSILVSYAAYSCCTIRTSAFERVEPSLYPTFPFLLVHPPSDAHVTICLFSEFAEHVRTWR